MRTKSTISTYIDEHKASNLNKAAVLADDYSLTHKRDFSQTMAKQLRSKEEFKRA